ncbi:hypothetical protein FNV43_RR08132 [Rhamnella rubrinervis]|uniref:LRAT domain-containing protein n=1 Tax=Rhamnella rubrinervis TaxID=2594499 RepID=A0A8K0HGJ6_9ROSA|nr:hypothetical protein FNV43_RR08132 [Rhamnella rubrinervis]
MQDFLCGGQLHRFEYGVSKFHFLMKRPGTCSLASSDPPEQVLQRAFYLLEPGFGNYHLFEKNCEDFSIYCKTGILEVGVGAMGSSEQILSLVSTLVSVALIPFNLLPSSFIVTALVLCGTYCIWRMLIDARDHRYLLVIPVEKLNHLRDADNARKYMMERVGRKWLFCLRTPETAWV